MENIGLKCWAAVNKNGFLVLFTEQPKRNEKTCKWEGNLYVNSVLYKTIKELFDKVNFNWEKEPEYFEFR
jgi:hypothetical protein